MNNVLCVLDRGITSLVVELNNEREKAARLEVRVVELEGALHELEGSAGLREQLDSSVKTNQELTSLLSHHTSVRRELDRVILELERTTHERDALRVQLESCVRTNQELTSSLETHKCPKPARLRKAVSSR